MRKDKKRWKKRRRSEKRRGNEEEQDKQDDVEERGGGRKVGMLVSHDFGMKNKVMLFLIISFCNVYLDRDTVIKFKKSLSTKHM